MSIFVLLLAASVFAFNGSNQNSTKKIAPDSATGFENSKVVFVKSDEDCCQKGADCCKGGACCKHKRN